MVHIMKIRQGIDAVGFLLHTFPELLKIQGLKLLNKGSMSHLIESWVVQTSQGITYK